VAVSKSKALVGAPDAVNGKGAGFVFKRSGTTWKEQATLTTRGKAKLGLGGSVAIDGSTAVVGAATPSGAAVVFVRSDKTWSQQAKLSPPDPAAVDFFGWAVAVSGSTAAVADPGGDMGHGSADVFVRSGTTWSLQAELTAADGGELGDSLALDGSTAVVGGGLNNSSTGAAYVYTRSGTTWSQEAKLTASDGAPGDFFGAGETGGAASISGSTAVIGAIGKNSRTGAAYVFTGL
jgi:hypothetical protein